MGMLLCVLVNVLTLLGLNQKHVRQMMTIHQCYGLTKTQGAKHLQNVFAAERIAQNLPRQQPRVEVYFSQKCGYLSLQFVPVWER